MIEGDRSDTVSNLLDTEEDNIRAITYTSLLPKTRQFLITLYGSYGLYLTADNIETNKNYFLEDICIMYDNAINNPMCATTALNMLGIEIDEDIPHMVQLYGLLENIINNPKEREKYVFE